jgi:hypothetical protein
MENKTYTVTWNPGAGGHLIRSIIEIEEFDLLTPLDTDRNGHDNGNRTSTLVHPYDRQALDITHKIIKPYFKREDLKFFQWFRNEVLWLKSNKYFIEELKEHWNTVDPICDISYNIDMTEFFTDLESFTKNIAEFLGKTELKHNTNKFIENKRNLNLPLYTQYLENVVDTVSCLKNKQHKDIQHLENIELAMVLCDFLHLNNKDTMNFCNRYDSKQLKSTKNILSYV